jgi:hypothetical protein
MICNTNNTQPNIFTQGRYFIVVIIEN